MAKDAGDGPAPALESAVSGGDGRVEGFLSGGQTAPEVLGEAGLG